jgi:GDSL-like Lipase/Acylhydrolase family
MWRSVTQYHATIGYTFIPGIKARVTLPREDTAYLIKVNESGFRCEHEFATQKKSGCARALLFGDSFTAGDGVANLHRYGDQLEQLVPQLEVFNFGLPGTGTDQHYLAYQEFARELDHDLLILGVTVENITRVGARFRPYIDEHGDTVIYAKPYYVLENNGLELRNVPVAKQPLSKSDISGEDTNYVDWGMPFANLRKLAKTLGLRDLAQKVTHFQPVPDYREANNPKWLVMRAILEEWIRQSRVPVIVMPIPLFPFVEGTSDPSAYQARFRELAAVTGCILHDPLADLRNYSPGERRSFRFEKDVHLTPAGHAALAASLAPVVERTIGSAEFADKEIAMSING